MELNKPYVWVKTIPDQSTQAELIIRCKCGTYRTLNMDAAVESEDGDRYIIEIPIGNSDVASEEFLYTTSDYDTLAHTKITVRVLDINVIKGSCTVIPIDDFFD